MESKQLHTERPLFGQKYHLNINLTASHEEFKLKLRNRNETHVHADYAKKSTKSGVC